MCIKSSVLDIVFSNFVSVINETWVTSTALYVICCTLMLRTSISRRVLRNSSALSQLATLPTSWYPFSTNTSLPHTYGLLAASDLCFFKMAKRKSSSMAEFPTSASAALDLPSFDNLLPPPTKRRMGRRSTVQAKNTYTNPEVNPEVLDGPEALRASPDAAEKDESLDVQKIEFGSSTHIKDEDGSVPSLVNGGNSESSLSDISDVEGPPSQHASQNKPRQLKKVQINTAKSQAEEVITKTEKRDSKEPQFLDPEAEGDEEADEEEIQAALSRPPPVHSDYLPLPWKGRLGYVRIDPKSFLLN